MYLTQIQRGWARVKHLPDEWQDRGWRKSIEPKKRRDHAVQEIAKHSLEEEVNNHRALLKSMNGCRTMGL